MNVGILTFHFCYNFGAVLQAVGLAKQVAQLGHNVEVIDFHPVELTKHPPWKGWGLRKKNPLQNIKLRWIDLYYGTLMRKSFDSFLKKNVSLSEPCNPKTIGTIVQQYDALVVGSDQVWNRRHYLAPQAYFLHFDEGYSGRKISYAACSGDGEIFGSQAELNFLKHALHDFDAVSVRNRFTQEWVRSISGMPSEVVADPTLLLDFTPYEANLSNPFHKYILVYTLGKEIQGGNQEIICEIRKNYGNLPVVWICSAAHKPQTYCTWADHQIATAGLGEWLSLIKNSTFFLTDSFHGMMFALKYKKSFLCFYSEATRAGRLLDAAERYGVNSCVVGSLQQANEKRSFSTPINYEKVSRLLEIQAISSRRYLQQALA